MNITNKPRFSKDNCNDRILKRVLYTILSKNSRNEKLLNKLTNKMLYSTQNVPADDVNVICELVDLPVRLMPRYFGVIDKLIFKENDVEDTLYLLHHEPDMDVLSKLFSEEGAEVLNKVLSIRGTIISINEKKILRKSYGCTLNVVVDYDRLTNEDVTVKLLGCETLIPFSRAELYQHYGGTFVSFWMYKGVRMFSTHKRIDARNSRWVDTTPFIEIFENDQDSFTRDNIPFADPEDVHHFILNDRELLVDVKSLQLTDQVIYLETVNMRTGKRSHNLLDFIVDGDSINKPFVLPKKLTLEEANEIIGTPEANTNVWLPGERIIVRHQNEKGEIFNYSVMRPNTYWRSLVFDGNGNDYQSVCRLCDTNLGFSLRKKAYKLEDLINIKERLEMGETDVLDPTLEYDTNNIWEIALNNIFFASPVHRLGKVMEVYTSLETDILNVSKWIVNHRQELEDFCLKQAKFPGLDSRRGLGKWLRTNFTEYFYNNKNYFDLTFFPKLESHITKKGKSKDENMLKRAIMLVLSVKGNMFYTLLRVPKKYTFESEIRPQIEKRKSALKNE